MISAEVNGQNKHTVTIEDQILIFPSRFSLRVNCVSSNILAKKWMGGEEYVSKDSVLKILGEIELLKIIEAPNDSIDKSMRRYLDVIYVEAKGIKPYNELKEKLHLKALILVEEYHVNNFNQLESSLIDKMIEDAKIIAIRELAENGKEINKILSYEEVKELSEATETYEEEALQNEEGFALLIGDKFIEENYQGHLINELGQIVLKKKLQVNFEIK
ncbi:hypothetical protein [Echinicola shivajiensis]|uniref:hypothetical protein n=1 Tax=Echinicola shivajiensis TaxID=1035916 RepID=UPI001BFC83B8|nr:hypothetical protein [Echinicola shivajiensis]